MLALSLSGWSRRCLLLVIPMGIHAAGMRLHAAVPPSTSHPHAISEATLGVQTWGFVPNVGQADPGVDFVCHAGAWSLLLDGSDAYLLHGGASTGDSPAHVLNVSLVGASAEAITTGEHPLPARVNYYVGPDPANWRSDVGVFGRVRHEAVYPGIDMVHYGSPRDLEFDFILAPGADPHAIGLRVEGAHQIGRDRSGAVLLHTPAGIIRMHPPYAYQENEEGMQPIPSAYVLRGDDCLGFTVSAYDPGRTLVIDPILDFATYLGGSSNEDAVGVEVAPDGSIYLAGSTRSPNFPVTPGTLETNFTGSSMMMVARMDATGENLLYATYLASSVASSGISGMDLDPSGDPIVTGFAWPGFPVTPGHIHTTAVNGAIFVLKLDDTGQLDFSTFIDGPSNEWGRDVAVDSSGNIYVLGQLWGASTMPVVNAFQAAHAGREDAVLYKLNPTATSILYGTYFGGSEREFVSKVAADDQGYAYIIGSTDSPDFPLKNAPTTQRNYGFVARFDTTDSGWSSLIYARCLGGTSGASAIDVADSGNAYLGGMTTDATTFPLTAGAFQLMYGGNGSLFPGDGFIMKISPVGLTLYGTYIGGEDEDAIHAIRAGQPEGVVHFGGHTRSQNFPVTNALQGAISGSCGGFGGCRADMVVGTLDPSLPSTSGMQFATYLGGADSDDIIRGLALTPSGEIVGVGKARENFPATPGVYQTTNAGTEDLVIFKLLEGASLSAQKTALVEPATREQEFTYTIVVSNAGPGEATSVEVVDPLPAGLVFQSASASQGACTESNGTVICQLGTIAVGNTATALVSVIPAVETVLTNAATVFCPTDPAIDDQPVTAVSTVVAPTDTDTDGLPDWWEQLHFDDDTAAAWDGNPDGDDLNNLEEYLADTDPTSPTPGPGVDWNVHSMPPRILIPISSPYRAYGLEVCTNLPLNAWYDVQTNVLGTGTGLLLTDPGESGTSAYRAKVGIPAP